MVAKGPRNLVQPESVRIAAGTVVLDGDLAVPPSARGIVLFAHGSGSGRLSPRNRAVAQHLNEHGFGTLLLDLLTRDEERVDERTGHLRFDIELLGGRLSQAALWLAQQMSTRTLSIGLFGASTGAGAALITAAEHPDLIKAVVSRGGRPDLAGEALPNVECPTLLIVGGNDEAVIDLNDQARHMMTALVTFEIINNATHLFEEPGALEQVATSATHWFERWL